MLEFIYPLRIHIEDSDYAGVVYHSNYLNYFERARSEWFHQLGLDFAWQIEQKIHFPVRSLKIDYLKPGRVHEKVEVISRIANIKHASLIFYQYLRHAGSNDTILCEAETKIACVDHFMKPRALPKLLKNLLTAEI